MPNRTFKGNTSSNMRRRGLVFVTNRQMRGGSFRSFLRSLVPYAKRLLPYIAPLAKPLIQKGLRHVGQETNNFVNNLQGRISNPILKNLVGKAQNELNTGINMAGQRALDIVQSQGSVDPKMTTRIVKNMVDNTINRAINQANDQTGGLLFKGGLLYKGGKIKTVKPNIKKANVKQILKRLKL